MIGRTLSHYTIEARLGRGGMGEVYAARDTRLGRTVAIKILPPGAAVREEAVRRFLSEAKTASALNHPNIVTVHDVDHDGELHFIVMEKIDGQPLSALAGTPMAVDTFLDLAIQVTAALGASHATGIVHRDIKPGNVMLTHSGTVKVVDFGLARLSVKPLSVSHDDATMQWDADTPVTAPGTIVGTVGYMSPEQVQGLPADARSDVFSLGVLFHELLTGTAPFRASTPVSTIAAILRDPAPSVGSLRTDVPRPLTALIARCLAKDPEQRYPTAAEIHRELVAIREARRQPSGGSSRLGRWALAAGVLAIAIAAAVTGFWWRNESRRRWARNEALPRIEKLWNDEKPVEAYALAREALAAAPDDPNVQQLWTNITFPIRVVSEPPGADLAIASYRGAEWLPLGKTPLELRLPFPLLKFRLTLDGFTTTITAPEGDPLPPFRLHRTAETPEAMVHVAAGETSFLGTRAALPEFWIDRHEVTNAEYKRFVDAGGYRNRQHWTEPIMRDGRTMAWDEAMTLFVDQTGRPGPSTWELGSYPDGRAQHPVEGVSWYEAAAYARWARKSLPTVFHWQRTAAQDSLFSDILTVSNFAGKGTVPVESLPGLGRHGTYDMAGNVEEWCLNPVGDKRYILGGAWMDASYLYAEEDAQPPLARGAGFGFRCIRQAAPLASEHLAEVSSPEPAPFVPVDDATFAVYARLYDYDPTPLDAKVEESDDSHAVWRRQRVSFNTAYGERMAVVLFLPKQTKPPYQTMVFYPGSDAVYVKSSRDMSLVMAEFFIRSGRALAYPILQGTYERQLPPPRGINDRRERRIQRAKDVRRTVDYLLSRPDVDHERIGYYGLSLGATNAPFVLATDKRFRTAILFAAGVSHSDLPPEVQSYNFLPHIRTPTLLLGGRYDFTIPYETAQKPFFDLVGCPPDRKRFVVFDAGHIPPQFNDTVREMLDWTDRWMGKVGD